MEKEGDLPVLIEPLLACLRQERYTYIKDLYIWQYPMNYENAATLVSMCMYCLIEPSFTSYVKRDIPISKTSIFGSIQ